MRNDRQHARTTSFFWLIHSSTLQKQPEVAHSSLATWESGRCEQAENAGSLEVRKGLIRVRWYVQRNQGAEEVQEVVVEAAVDYLGP